MEAAILAVVLVVIVLLVVAVLVLAWLLVERAEAAAQRDAVRAARDADERRILLRYAFADTAADLANLTRAEDYGDAVDRFLATVNDEPTYDRDPLTGEDQVPLSG